MRASKQRLSNNGVVAVLRKPVLVLAFRLRQGHHSVPVPGIVKKYEGNLSRFSRPITEQTCVLRNRSLRCERMVPLECCVTFKERLRRSLRENQSKKKTIANYFRQSMVKFIFKC